MTAMKVTLQLYYRTMCRMNVLTPAYAYEAFECMEAIITSGNGNMRLVVVYRPQDRDPAIGHFIPHSVCSLTIVSKVIDHYLTAPAKLLVTGDFNFHVDIPIDTEVKCMLHALDMMNLHQLENEPTHKDGST